MSALITVTPLVPPVYDSTHIAKFSAWYRDNEPTLVERWHALGGTPTDDYLGFILARYDVERVKAGLTDALVEEPQLRRQHS